MLRFSSLLPALVGVLILGLTACRPEAPSAGLAPAYFDLKTFLDGQRNYLESVSPTVTKTVTTGAGPAETQRLARTNWERELSFFYDADLNKPALRGAYAEITTRLPNDGTRHTYTRRPGQHGAVRRLIVDLGPEGAVRQVEAEQDDANMLFRSSRHLLLRCDPTPDHNRLLAYSVDGRQKLIFFAETRYGVQGEVE